MPHVTTRDVQKYLAGGSERGLARGRVIADHLRRVHGPLPGDAYGDELTRRVESAMRNLGLDFQAAYGTVKYAMRTEYRQPRVKDHLGTDILVPEDPHWQKTRHEPESEQSVLHHQQEVSASSQQQQRDSEEEEGEEEVPDMMGPAFPDPIVSPKGEETMRSSPLSVRAIRVDPVPGWASQAESAAKVNDNKKRRKR